MPDREKVIKGLEVCTSIEPEGTCPKDCPYYQEVCYGNDQIMRDALALLKEQKETEPDYKKYISIEWLMKYTTFCCSFDMNKNAVQFVDTWFRMHEMCCCKEQDKEVQNAKVGEVNEQGECLG